MPARDRTKYPFVTEDLRALPPALADLTIESAVAEHRWRRVFVVPEAPVGCTRRRIQQAVAFDEDGLLSLVAGSRPADSQAVWLPYADILQVRLSLILLYGRLEVWGSTSEGIAKIDLEYQTVAHPVLHPEVEHLLSSTWKPAATKPLKPEDRPSLEQLEALSYSFCQGLRLEGLRAGDHLVGYVYQPEIRVPWLRWLTRPLAPQTLLALTDRQLILVQEDLRFQTHHEWILSFFPLGSTRADEYTVDRDWQILTLAAGTGSDRLQTCLRLWPETAGRWRTLWATLQPAPRGDV